MITTLRRNIFDVSNTIIALNSRSYYQVVPQNTAYPYLVFFQVTGTPEHDTGNEFEDVYIQFSIYDYLKNLTSLEAVYKELTQKLITSNFTLSDYDVIHIIRQFNRDAEFDKVAQIVTQYKFHLQKK